MPAGARRGLSYQSVHRLCRGVVVVSFSAPILKLVLLMRFLLQVLVVLALQRVSWCALLVGMGEEMALL